MGGVDQILPRRTENDRQQGGLHDIIGTLPTTIRVDYVGLPPIFARPLVECYVRHFGK